MGDVLGFDADAMREQWEERQAEADADRGPLPCGCYRMELVNFGGVHSCTPTGQPPSERWAE
jgi:hypothetical protein